MFSWTVASLAGGASSTYTVTVGPDSSIAVSLAYQGQGWPSRLNVSVESPSGIAQLTSEC